MIHLLYGQPGTGKSTLATGILIEYAGEHKRVAANYHIDLSPVSNNPKGGIAQTHVTVLPDRPTIDDLLSLGTGWHDDEFGREDRSGLLVIDEAGPWLSSRSWNEKNRQEIIDWFLHSRKRGWDVVLIAQAPSLVDKQIREAVIEGYARCRRMDRVKVPVLGVSLPRVHIAVARYGLDLNAPVLQRWWYRGTDVHKCYQSYAIFGQSSPEGLYSTLPPRLTKWRGYQSLFEKLLGWFNQPPKKVTPRPKNPLVQLLSKLPPDQALKHWQRLNMLGAFNPKAAQTRKRLPLGVGFALLHADRL